MTFETIRELALELPGVEEGTTYGSPALKVHRRMFACIPVNRSAKPNSLAVRVSIHHRDRLLADAPKVYYVTDHYREHPIVLVRLGRIRRDALLDLLRLAYRFASTGQNTKGKTTRRRKS